MIDVNDLRKGDLYTRRCALQGDLVPAHQTRPRQCRDSHTPAQPAFRRDYREDIHVR